MKKLLISLFLISGLFVGGKSLVLNAEETTSEVSETTSEEVSSVEEVTSSEVISSNEVSVTSETNVIEENKEKIEDKLNEWFSPQVVALIMSLLGYIGTILGLANSLKKLKKEKNLTAQDVKEQVCAELEKVVSKQVVEKVAVYFDSAEKMQKEIKDVLETFAKILALSQENTPESRVAILELIQRLGNNTNGMIETIKETINTQEKEKEEKKQANDEKLNKIIDDGTSI